MRRQVLAKGRQHPWRRIPCPQDDRQRGRTRRKKGEGSGGGETGERRGSRSRGRLRWDGARPGEQGRPRRAQGGTAVMRARPAKPAVSEVWTHRSLHAAWKLICSKEIKRPLRSPLCSGDTSGWVACGRSPTGGSESARAGQAAVDTGVGGTGDFQPTWVPGDPDSV